jgi:sortase A
LDCLQRLEIADKIMGNFNKLNMPTSLGSKAFRVGELLSYTAGAALMGFFCVQIAQGEVDRQLDIQAFESAMPQTAFAQVNAPESLDAAQFSEPTSLDTTALGEPDTTLWAPGRIEDYQASLTADLPEVMGVLEIPSLKLKVPVYSTDTELTMDRGAGIVDGMAYPHEPGNIGISGHRDGYFRVLKDVQLGDKIVLQTLEGPKQFTIDTFQVVDIKDVSLLQDTREQTVTLVTCYPFYFVGHAPQRFIVTASLDSTIVNQH